jgi:hypothetical protein
MGEFHNYAGLDGDFAVKVAKFKQDRMLDALVKNKMIPKESFRFQVSGACWGMVLSYLSNNIRPGGVKLPRAKGPEPDKGSLAFAGDSVAIQEIFEKDYDPEKWSKKVSDVYQQFGLFAEFDPETYKDFNTLFKTAVGYLGCRPGIYISVDWEKKSNGHAIALFKEDKKIYFFDPDCGEYQVKKPLTFAKAWSDVKQSKFGLTAKGGNIVLLEALKKA